MIFLLVFVTLVWFLCLEQVIGQLLCFIVPDIFVRDINIHFSMCPCLSPLVMFNKWNFKELNQVLNWLPQGC